MLQSIYKTRIVKVDYQEKVFYLREFSVNESTKRTLSKQPSNVTNEEATFVEGMLLSCVAIDVEF